MDEKTLIQKSLAGEEKAFEILFSENREAVYRHCLGVVKDEEIAQDLTQETFLHAFQHLSSFQRKARFSTWLWRIAHNLALSYLKKHRHIEQEFLEELLPPNRLLEKEAGVDEALMQKIQEGIATLPPKQRIVFKMYVLKHIPQKEIAARLGISHGTVRSRLHYARKKIKSHITLIS